MGSRSWIFTLNNFSSPLDFSTHSCVRYASWQHERGENGTDHYQGYIELSAPQRLSYMKNVIPGAHFEKRQGTREQARDYSRKDDTRIDGPWEYGEWIKDGQGSRSDLTSLVESVKKGSTNLEILDIYPASYLRYFRGIDRIRHDLCTPRNFKTTVWFIWGDTNLGKTSYALSLSPTAYIKQRGEWWDGYDGHSDVLIDDFYGWLKYDTLLRLCDRYPCQVEIKGGHVNFAPKNIYITSNNWPNKWYKDTHYWPALARRVEHFVYFNGMNSFIDHPTLEQHLGLG